MSGHTVLVLGTGDVGFGVIRELGWHPHVSIVACRRSEEAGEGDVNLLTTYFETLGRRPDVAFHRLDLSDVARITEMIERVKPDVVLQCATALPYWRIRQLPDPVSGSLIDAGLGWTAPMNLQYPINVGRALDDANLDGPVRFVNASIPDYTNVVLERLRLPCDCGIGNIGGGRIAMLRRAAAARLGEPSSELTLYAAFPHAVAANLRSTKSTGGLPYYLKVFHRGADVTEEVDADERLKRGWPELPTLSYPDRGYPLAVASATRVVRAMLHDSDERVHVPGPNGRPGGWPCRVNRDGVEVVVPSDTDEGVLHDVNVAGLRADGIRNIEDDGTIVFTDRSRRLVEDAIDYDCERLSPEELERHELTIERKIQRVA